MRAGLAWWTTMARGRSGSPERRASFTAGKGTSRKRGYLCFRAMSAGFRRFMEAWEMKGRNTTPPGVSMRPVIPRRAARVWTV